MNLLCIECSTENCSVALLQEDRIHCEEEVAPRRHNDLVLEMCSRLLEQTSMQRRDLDAVAFGRGPGAFTGVRIAAAVTQGIAYALSLPVIRVSTLEILAQRALEEQDNDYVLPIIDARMDEVYWTVCTRDASGCACTVAEERVQKPVQVSFDFNGDCIGIGSGWLRYPQIENSTATTVWDNRLEHNLPSARHLAILARREWLAGNLCRVEDAQPVYVRNQIVAAGAK